MRANGIATEKFSTGEIEIPANTTATVYVPASDLDAVFDGRGPAIKSPGVKSFRFDGRRVVLEIGSGKYHFVSK